MVISNKKQQVVRKLIQVKVHHFFDQRVFLSLKGWENVLVLLMTSACQ